MSNIFILILLLSVWNVDGLMVSDTEPVYTIMCELYNEKNCSSPNGCDFQVELCESDTACYTVWSETGEVKMKGCFPDNQECNQRDCIANSLSPNGLLFCCCNEPLCNEEYEWVPDTQENLLEEIVEDIEDDLTFYVLVLGVIPCIFIISLVVTATYVISKKHFKDFGHDDLSIMESGLHSNIDSSFFTVKLLDIKTKGKYGAVWMGKICDEIVAVKISEDELCWRNESEIYNLRGMRHPNILEFLSAENQSRKEFWLITTYHNNGSLNDYLKNNTLSWEDVCKIVKSVTTGLMFLHEEKNEKPSIAHRDFKSQNIILKSDLTACIADFGLSMVFNSWEPPLDKKHSQVGTKRYMAPEVIEGAIDFNRDAFLRIDIYACGLVLWEIVSMCDIYTSSSDKYSLPFEAELGMNPSLQELHKVVVQQKLRPKISDDWRTHNGINLICNTIEECWDHNVEARISSSCIMERMNEYSTMP